MAERTPLYGYVPIARSGIECLALAFWLADPGIEIGERARRSLNERIASAYEQQQLPAGLNPEPGRLDRLRQATRAGFELGKSKKGGRRYFKPEPPTITAQVKRVLDHDRLGKVTYSYTSAISHGTLWGLNERVEIVDERTRGPLVNGRFKIGSDYIGWMAAALVMAHIRAFGAYAAYVGWGVEEWQAARRRALQLIGSFLGQRPPLPEPEWELATPGGLWLPEPRASWAAPRSGPESRPRGCGVPPGCYQGVI